MSKAKLGGRQKETQKAAPRVFVTRERALGGYGCFCLTTGRLVSAGETAIAARKRAGKRGWAPAD